MTVVQALKIQPDLDAADAREEVAPWLGARGRLIFAIAVVAVFCWGRLAQVLDIAYVGELATSAFLQFGPGIVFCLLVRPRQGSLFALLSLVVGPSVLVLVGMATALTGDISFGTAGAVLGAVTLVLVALCGLRDGRQLRVEERTPPGSGEDTGWVVSDKTDRFEARRLGVRFGPAVVAVSGLLIAVLAAATHRGVPQPSGVALTAGPLWFVGAALSMVAVGWAWRIRGGLAGPVLALSTLVVASQAVMYREPTVVVSARHIGIVEYLLANGRLDRSTDIYQGWSGLFSATAVNVQAAQIDQVFLYAACWAVVAAPVMVFAVRCLAARFLDYRRAWLAGLVFALASSLNTVFFAPQVFGFVLSIAILVLVITPPGSAARISLPVRLWTVALLSVAVAVTHQISPYMLTCALVALVIFRLVRPWWVFMIPLVPAVGWALLNQHLLARYVDSSAFGQLLSNLAPPDNSVGTFAVPLANRLTFLLPAAALVCIGLVALYKLIRTRSRVSLGLGAASASSVLIMAGTAYGNEGVFRVALFALPWLAILACLPRADRADVRSSRLGAGLLAGAFVALFVVSVIGQSGMDWARVIRPGDVQAVTYIESTAPEDSEVLALGSVLTLPYDSTARYDASGWLSREDLTPPPGRGFPAEIGPAYDPDADLASLTAKFRQVPANRHYAIISDSMGAYDQRYGNQTFADHRKLAAAIATSRQWRPVFSAEGVQVFELRDQS